MSTGGSKVSPSGDIHHGRDSTARFPTSYSGRRSSGRPSAGEAHLRHRPNGPIATSSRLDVCRHLDALPLAGTVGGVEVALAQHWTVGVQYLYADLGSRDAFDIVPGGPGDVSSPASFIRATIGWRFWSSASPRVLIVKKAGPCFRLGRPCMAVFGNTPEPSHFMQSLDDSRVHDLHNSDRLGVGLKRNQFLKRIREKIILLFDDDDFCALGYLSRMLSVVRSRDGAYIKIFTCPACRHQLRLTVWAVGEPGEATATE
ncbi:MAG: glycosyltransferase family A protein [Pseudolabrys sp.]|jgi:hypothetical protein